MKSQSTHRLARFAPATESSHRERRRRSLRLEVLELRTLFSVTAASSTTGVVGSQGVEPIDGGGNNVADPTLGSADTEFACLAPPNYGDGIDAPNGQNLPSARVISNLIATQDI